MLVITMVSPGLVIWGEKKICDRQWCIPILLTISLLCYRERYYIYTDEAWYTSRANGGIPQSRSHQVRFLESLGYFLSNRISYILYLSPSNFGSDLYKLFISLSLMKSQNYIIWSLNPFVIKYLLTLYPFFIT